MVLRRRRRPLSTRSPGTGAFALIADELQRARPPRRGGVLHVGPHQQRGGVSLPAVRPRRSAPTTCPTAPTCATSPSGAALDRDHRHRQGHGDARRLRARRPDLHRRPEPRHQSSAHALDAGEGQATAPASSHQPASRAGLHALQGPAEGQRRRSGTGTQLADDFLPGPHQRRRGAVPGNHEGAARGRGARRPARFSTTPSSTSTAAGFDDIRRRTRDDRPGTRSSQRPGSTRAADRASAADIAVAEAHDLLLGDGPHTAQERRRHHRRSHQSPAAARHIGKPGAGVCPVRGHSNVQGDRTIGIWEKMPDEFLDALDARVRRSRRRAKHGLTPSTRSGRWHDGDIKVFMAHGRQFPVGLARHRVHAEPRCASAGSPCRSRTKLNRGHLVTGNTALILPCLGRTEQRCASDGANSSSPSKIRCRWCTCRAARCRRPAITSAVKSSIVCRHRPARRSGRARRSTGTACRRLRHDPRPHLTRRARVRRLQQPRPPAGRVPPATSAARRAHFRTPTGKAQLRHNPLHGCTSRERPLHPADHAQPRPVQHHDLRPRRPLPRHQGRPPRGVCMNPEDITASGSPKARLSIWSPSSTVTGGIEERRVEGVPDRRLPHSPRQRGGVLPGDQSPRAARHVAAKSNTPVSKAVTVRLERALSGTQPAHGRAVRRITAERHAISRADTLAVEEPLEIRVAGESLSVTMRTPGRRRRFRPRIPVDRRHHRQRRRHRHHPLLRRRRREGATPTTCST